MKKLKSSNFAKRIQYRRVKYCFNTFDKKIDRLTVSKIRKKKGNNFAELCKVTLLVAILCSYKFIEEKELKLNPLCPLYDI